MILERDDELTALSAAAAAAGAGCGAFVLVEGPAGIGKTSLLRAACTRPPAPGLRILTARGLALERGFGYGIARQLLEPARAGAGPGEWDELLDGAAGLAARVFGGAEAGPVGDDVAHATTHGLYWLVANLATRDPLLIVVDDAHWADEPSLRWLAHLAARIESLPIALLLAARDGPDQPVILDELRASPGCTPLRLGPLGSTATEALLRDRLGGRADAALCQACHASTGGNPFLLESLASALRELGAGSTAGDVERLGPQPVAQAVLRRVGQLGGGTGLLTRALAVLGGPAPLRHAAGLSGLDLADAARLADRLRAADVLAPGSTLEFAHPIVRAAIYESIPPGERSLAHAAAAQLLAGDGADAERVALHLLHSEPDGSPQVTAMLRAAATAASGRGAHGRGLPAPRARRATRSRDQAGAAPRARGGPGQRPQPRRRDGIAAGGRTGRDHEGPRIRRAAGRSGPRHLGSPRQRDPDLPRRAGRRGRPRFGRGRPGSRAFRQLFRQRCHRRRGVGAGSEPPGGSPCVRALARLRRPVRDRHRPAGWRRAGPARPGPG
jgi:hypothetical protein